MALLKHLGLWSSQLGMCEQELSRLSSMPCCRKASTAGLQLTSSVSLLVQCHFLGVVGKYQPVFVWGFSPSSLTSIIPVGTKGTKETRPWLQCECRDEIEEVIYPKGSKYCKVFVFDRKI